MAFTEDGGIGAHHVVLLWPAPFCIVGIALSGLAARSLRGVYAAVAIASLLCVVNLAVLNQYAAQFIRNGAGPIWSDANTALLTSPLPPGPAYVADWGTLYSLRLFWEGQREFTDLRDALVSDNAASANRVGLNAAVASPKALFITHTPPFEVLHGASARLDRIASEAGYSRVPVRTFLDSNGRAVFEVVRFAPSGVGRSY
jgi:hypothetical protein